MNDPKTGRLTGISAIILAAGLSRRMGAAKMILSWGATTVLGKVVSTLTQSGIGEIVVVAGGIKAQIESALSGSKAKIVFNPDYESGEMLQSLKIGLNSLSPTAKATLVALGDQPLIEMDVVDRIIKEYQTQRPLLVVPSFQMRRGHPWLVDRKLWTEIIALPVSASPRLFLNQHRDDILYVNVNTPSIFQDLDTPEDYERLKPGTS